MTNTYKINHDKELTRLFSDNGIKLSTNIYQELERLERNLNNLSERECNGEIRPEVYESLRETYKQHLSGWFGPLFKHLIVNRDPIGYSLIFTEEYSKKVLEHYDLARDAGGHVLIAPDAYELEETK